MATALLTLHLFIALGLVIVVLLQKSEGGGLGMGTGSSGFMTGRGTANLLTRATAALAALFFLTSISLTLLANKGQRTVSPFDAPVSQSGPQSLPAPAPGPTPPPATPDTGVLKKLEEGKGLPKSQ